MWWPGSLQRRSARRHFIEKCRQGFWMVLGFATIYMIMLNSVSPPNLVADKWFPTTLPQVSPQHAATQPAGPAPLPITQDTTASALMQLKAISTTPSSKIPPPPVCTADYPLLHDRNQGQSLQQAHPSADMSTDTFFNAAPVHHGTAAVYQTDSLVNAWSHDNRQLSMQQYQPDTAISDTTITADVHVMATAAADIASTFSDAKAVMRGSSQALATLPCSPVCSIAYKPYLAVLRPETQSSLILQPAKIFLPSPCWYAEQHARSSKAAVEHSPAMFPNAAIQLCNTSVFCCLGSKEPSRTPLLSFQHAALEPASPGAPHSLPKLLLGIMLSAISVLGTPSYASSSIFCVQVWRKCFVS